MKFFKILISAALIAVMPACAKDTVQEQKDVSLMLKNMKKYETYAQITYISDKSESVYKGIHYAADDGRYCIQTQYPPEYENDKVICDGKMIWHLSGKNKDTLSASIPDRPERAQIILFEFTKNMLSTPKADMQTEGEYTVLSAAVPETSRHFASEKLWLNTQTSLPEKLVIYDKDNNERIKVEFSDFKYDPQINDDVFKVQAIDAK